MAVPLGKLPEHCHWVRVPKVGLVHIPACCGAANGGPHDCTCDLPLSDKETNWKQKYRATQKALSDARDRIGWLEQELKSAGKRYIPLVGEVTKLKIVRR